MQHISEEFFRHLKKVKDFDEEAFKLAHFSNISKISVRLNPFKATDLFLETEKIPWCQSGRYLTQRPSFTIDPLFHAGCYYVQEPSSMFIEEVFRQKVDLSKQIKVLDLCAAPGGKSTLINSIISQESFLVSNEVVKSRVPILCDNMAKWGTTNHVVTNNQAGDFKKLKDFFDIIVIDAPCSGSGMFRKSEESINQWSLKLVEQCSYRQRIILKDVLPALKENGLLIYSTCSYSSEENEEIADYLVNEFKLETISVNLENRWGVIETESPVNKAKGYRFYPYLTNGEGFYLSIFKNPKKSDIVNRIKARIFNQSISKLPEKFNIDDIKHRTVLKSDNSLFSILSNEIVNAYFELKTANFNIIKNGISAGELKGSDFIPHHDFALGNFDFPLELKAPLNKEEAIDYLRGGMVKNRFLPDWNLATFNNFGLGWFKQIGNRTNNYYPKPLRIKKPIESFIRI